MAEPNTSRSAIAGRELVAVAGLNFSFLVSCYFYGAGFNPVFLIPVYVGPLLLLLMLNHARISELWSTQRNLFWASCCVVFCIAFQHLFFSISPDSSFIPSLVLASLPIWAVTAAFLHDRERLWMGVSAIVCIFALISVFDFIVLQQRAHAPLWDPNSYATLLYLVWVPWVLRYLGTEQSRKTADGLCFGLTTVFCLAMLATESRWAMLVIGSVGSFVVLSCWWFKLSWKNAMYPLGGMVLASAVAFVVADSGASGPTVQVSSFELARSETHRLLMLEATSEAIRDLGGWSGTGLYTFSLVYPLYRTVGEQHTTGLFAHNDFIQFALEGGVWLTVPMVMFAAWVFYHIAVALKGKVWQRDIGMLIALGLVIANSLVNYVFYTLPLLILIGILIGCYWQRVEKKVGEGTDTKHVRPVATRLARVAMLGVWMFTCATLYLDSLTFGVFSNHLHVPGSVQIRTSNERMLDFSRFVQEANSRRGIPVLAEARILETQLATRPELLASTVDAYRRSIEVDPWNPLAYRSFAEFLTRTGDPELSRVAIDLVKQAYDLNPADAANNLAVIGIASRTGGEIEAARNVLTWCRLIGKQREAGAIAIQRASFIFEEAGFVSEHQRLTDCRDHTLRTNNSGSKTPTWMMRWLRDSQT